jgi:ribose transport system ATP-binding protein
VEKEILLKIRQMRKNFDQTIALKGVDLDIYAGQVLGIIGENGSGKSTVMSISAGLQSPTSGEMTFKGQPWQPRTMHEAQQKGISMILQEANTIPHVTVAQNIFASREKMFSQGGFMRMNRMAKAADKLLDDFGIDHIRGGDLIDVHGYEERKLVELVRCVTDETQILIVDETTTALSHEGREILYSLIHKMAKENKAVVFISHDIDEILTHCDALTVLRDGEIVGHLDKEQMQSPQAVSMIRQQMVGREIGDKYYREDFVPSCLPEVALEMSDVSFGGIEHFSLSLHKGEIVGIGGLSSCGMHEIGRAAYGLEKLKEGRVLCGGKPIETCLDAIESGIGYISKNRDTEALILEASIQENITLPSLGTLRKRGYISPGAEKSVSDKEIEQFRIKAGSGRQWVSTLSGGNKQKVSFAKWTAKDSGILIMDCPTRGVDIGVKQFMYTLVEEMKREGKAILMISEELSELIGMCDRLLVMKDFRVEKTFQRSPDLKQTDVIEHMI